MKKVIIITAMFSALFCGDISGVSYFNYAQSYFKGRPNTLKLIKAQKDRTNTKSIRFDSLATYLPLEDSLNDSNAI